MTLGSAEHSIFPAKQVCPYTGSTRFAVGSNQTQYDIGHDALYRPVDDNRKRRPSFPRLQCAGRNRTWEVSRGNRGQG